MSRMCYAFKRAFPKVDTLLVVYIVSYHFYYIFTLSTKETINNSYVHYFNMHEIREKDW